MLQMALEFREQLSCVEDRNGSTLTSTRIPTPRDLQERERWLGWLALLARSRVPFSRPGVVKHALCTILRSSMEEGYGPYTSRSQSVLVPYHSWRVFTPAAEL